MEDNRQFLGLRASVDIGLCSFDGSAWCFDWGLVMRRPSEWEEAVGAAPASAELTQSSSLVHWGGSHEALTGDRCGDRIPVPVFRWRHVFCVNLIQVTTASVFSFPCHNPGDWCHVAWHGAILPIRQSDKSQNGCATVIRRAFLARARV